MLTWHEVPFVRILIPYVLGLLLSLELSIHLNEYFGWLYTMPIVFLIFIYKAKDQNRIWGGVLISLSRFFLGYEMGIRTNPKSAISFFEKSYTPQSTLVIELDTDLRTGKTLSVKGKIKALRDSSGVVRKASGTIQLYIELDTLSEELKLGDILEVQCRIQNIEGPKNPHAFDFRQYMFYQGIQHQGFVKMENWSF